MKVLKPDWINHNGHPVYSIDIHPDGSRLATGGQGEDSGRVVIWNMGPVVEEEEEGKDKPRMLCQLDNHLACVNCVRWSGSGRYLASGGDDKLVMIWTISKGGGQNTIFGSKGKVNVEGWRCSFTLRGHHGDILDMAWAPRDHFLATCSVDNTIIIWKPDNFPEMVQVVKGHTGLVKGVSWDPVGKYLGSQSDDKTVRIWKTVDWSEETVISKPFKQCGGTTMVLRLSWSPDGQYLVTAHAMNGDGPTAKIIERDGWTSKRDIVGHRKAVTCVRYSRRLMEKEKKKGKTSRTSVCAVGSRDRGVSVWMTSSPRPLVVLEDLFSSPVLDLAWDPCGVSFMACSGDGTVAFIQFTEEEIGRPLTDAEREAVLERLYGKADLLDAGDGLQVVENPSFLMPLTTPKESKGDGVVTNGIGPAKEAPLPSSKAAAGFAPPPASSSTPAPSLAPIPSSTPPSSSASNPTPSPAGPQNQPVTASIISGQPPASTKQIETRTSDGRRRITPIFIPLSHDNSNEVLPFGSDTMPSSSSCQKSRIVVERRDDVVVTPNVTPVKSAPNSSTVTPPNASHTQMSTPSLPTPSTNLPSPSGVTESGGFTGLVTMAEKLEVKREETVAKRTPKITRLGKAKKRKVEEKEEGWGSRSPALLAPLSPLSSSAIKLLRSPNIVRVENKVQKGAYGNISIVRLEAPNNAKPLWEVVLGSEVVSCCGTDSTVAIATGDHCLRLLSTRAGEMILPPIALGAPAAVLKLSSGYLLVATTAGRLSVWCLAEAGRPRALLSSQDVTPLTSHTAETKIKECFVTKSGEPLVAFSSGKAFFYSRTHNSWLMIGNQNDTTVRGAMAGFRSSQQTTSSPSGENYPLKAIQTAALNGLPAGGVGSGSRGLSATSELAPLCTLAYLDAQLSSAQAIGSQQEYKFWLLALSRFLVQRGLESRLKILCESLLGPMHSSIRKTKATSWEDEILGLKKHTLLEEILDEAKNNVKLQRLVTEVREQLMSKTHANSNDINMC